MKVSVTDTIEASDISSAKERMARVTKIEILSDGSTDVAIGFIGTPVTYLAKLMTPIGLLFQGSMRNTLRKDILDLKQNLENYEHA